MHEKIVTTELEIEIPLSKLSNEQIKKKGDFLAENFEIIEQNFELILENKKYFYTELYNAYLSLAFIKGGYIPLGVLVLLWKEEKLIGTCPDCKGKVYIIGVGGSPLRI